ncbi:MAG: hypothetical protein FJ009_16435 [Chloroflexi bacterium]|nr:hypothetical protein [Chloroflexota bacterium]
MNEQRIPYRRLRGQRAPFIFLQLYHADRQTEDYAFVDSGATYSIFDLAVAERLGIDAFSGRHDSVIGMDGRLASIYLHTIGLEIGTFHLTAEVGFSEQLRIGFNLLGRHSVFNQLQFCFNDRDGELIVSRL